MTFQENLYPCIRITILTTFHVIYEYTGQNNWIYNKTNLNFMLRIKKKFLIKKLFARDLKLVGVGNLSFSLKKIRINGNE